MRILQHDVWHGAEPQLSPLPRARSSVHGPAHLVKRGVVGMAASTLVMPMEPHHLDLVTLNLLHSSRLQSQWL